MLMQVAELQSLIQASSLKLSGWYFGRDSNVCTKPCYMFNKSRLNFSGTFNELHPIRFHTPRMSAKTHWDPGPSSDLGAGPLV